MIHLKYILKKILYKIKHIAIIFQVQCISRKPRKILNCLHFFLDYMLHLFYRHRFYQFYWNKIKYYSKFSKRCIFPTYSLYLDKFIFDIILYSIIQIARKEIKIFFFSRFACQKYSSLPNSLWDSYPFMCSLDKSLSMLDSIFTIGAFVDLIYSASVIFFIHWQFEYYQISFTSLMQN